MAKIFLIGMMGTGKSHWAEKWGRKLEQPAFDLDQEVEKKAGCTIAELFETKGESYFREAESRQLREFGRLDSFLLATGGGTPCHAGNMDWMNQQGITIWLNEPLEILVGRLKLGKAHRPLLKDLEDTALYDYLARQLETRKPFYSQAQYIFGHGEISNKVIDNIIAANGK